jgi:hypothetical protein
VLEYNIHKERKDSTRFAKGMSETFQTLHGLVDKGVKVELGIPFEVIFSYRDLLPAFPKYLLFLAVGQAIC